MGQRIAGLIQVKINGVIQDAKGAFDVGYGAPKRTAITGQDRVHGFKEEVTVPYIEGTLTDRGSMNLAAIFNGTDQTVTVQLGNGKTAVLRNCWYAGEGKLSTAESEVPVRWEGGSLQEIS